jgi:hypothetical protein
VTDLNEIKAGRYQLVAQSWEHITSKPTEPLDFTRYVRGDIVELNVEDAKRLFAAGAVVVPGQLEKAAVERARAEFELAQAQLNALISGLPDDVRAEVAPDTVAQEPDGSGTEPFNGLNRGSGTDAWRAFAVSEAAGDKRLTADDAGAKSRDELAALFMGPKEPA